MRPHVELIVGNRQVLGVFVILVLLLGVFFTAGYVVGRARGGAELEARRASRQPPPQPTPEVPEQIEFVAVPPGEFVMGFRAGMDDSWYADVDFSEELEWMEDFPKRIAEDCRPAHRVRITRGFEMSRYEVTERQWSAVMNERQNGESPPDFPRENVTWQEAQEFIARLNARRDGHTYRLATEAEWEYAARAGTSGPDTDDMYIGAWDYPFAERGVTPVVAVNHSAENNWGLFGMLGNVTEWCQDWYGSKYYRSSRYADPQGPRSGRRRVLRGGAYNYPSYTVFVWSRDADDPGAGSEGIGLRLVRQPMDRTPVP